jgi:hypothetical protein
LNLAGAVTMSRRRNSEATTLLNGSRKDLTSQGHVGRNKCDDESQMKNTHFGIYTTKKPPLRSGVFFKNSFFIKSGLLLFCHNSISS